MVLAGDLDSATLNALPESARTIVTAPGDLPVTEEMTYTPSQVTSVGSRTVLTPAGALLNCRCGAPLRGAAGLGGLLSRVCMGA